MMSLPFHPSRLCTGIILLVIGFWVGAINGRAEDRRQTPLPEEVFPELRSILEQALQQSPQMMLKNIELAQSEAARILAVSQLMPSLGTSVSYNLSNAAVSSNTDVKSRASGLVYSASLSQSVFRWGTVRAQAEAAKVQLNITRRNYADAYRQLAVTIRNQYLGLVAKKVGLNNAVAARERAAYLLSLEEAKLKLGLLSPSAVLISPLDFEEAIRLADRAAEDLAAAKRYFSRLTGLPEISDERIPGAIPAVPFDPAVVAEMARKFVTRDWEMHPAIVTARDWVRVGELNYKSAKYRLYPMFSFGAGISQVTSTQASQNTVAQVGVVSHSVGLTASWTIFDGRATKGAQITARANQRYYERNLQTQTDLVLDQVRSLEKQIGFTYRAVQLAEIRYGQAEATAKLLKDELAEGLTSQVALDGALAMQEIYTLNLVNSRLDLLSRWSEFFSTVEADPALKNLPATLKSNVR